MKLPQSGPLRRGTLLPRAEKPAVTRKSLTDENVEERVTNGSRVPDHVAIIMDGNGRWAQARGLVRAQGHVEGARAVREAVRASRETGVRFLTLYAFSVANWSRPRPEVEALMRLLQDF